MVKELNSHHDRLEAYQDHELITAILRTLREVVCLKTQSKLLGAQEEPRSDENNPEISDGLLRTA